ncbi:MAG: FAD-dependent oxidoreductase [Planctomycetia bacterium]|nr:FAD-dependent oxidoreductase [Planctomycetia bacterium]
MTPRVAIIGAGLAGLTSAHRLLSRKSPPEVIVIDKGRRAGGRTCTRAVDLPDGRTATFDLGPPILYARSRNFKLERPWHRAVALAGELGGEELFTSHEIQRIEEEAPDYPPRGLTAKGGMRELAFRVLSKHRDTLTFHDHTLAEKLERIPTGWRISIRSLRDDSTDVVSANALILTAPAPQALELLQKNSITLPDDLRDTLRTVQYSRCIALYGRFSGGDSLQPGGVWIGDGPIEWITDNHSKEVSQIPNSITALTSSAWAEEHWQLPDERIIGQLLPALRAWVGEPLADPPVAIQKWSYAKPQNPLRVSCAVVSDLALILAGDGFAGMVPDPADAAIVSGEAAARRMEGLLTKLMRADERFTVARPTHYTLEIAVTTPEEALYAASSGADRLELSSALELGGLTPSLGLFRLVKKWAKVPIYVLIRPRPGGFTYTADEFDVMERDTELFLEAGADGVVFGILNPDGTIDTRRCQQLIAHVQKKNRNAVFHRAFDFVPDRLSGLDELIELGFERVLTSGGSSTAETGSTRLAALVQHAGWQIEVLPAGNIRSHNVADLIRETRCDQVHAAVRVPVTDPLLATNSRVAEGMGKPAEMSTDAIRKLREQLDELVGSLS